MLLSLILCQISRKEIIKNWIIEHTLIIEQLFYFGTNLYIWLNVFHISSQCLCLKLEFESRQTRKGFFYKNYFGVKSQFGICNCNRYFSMSCPKILTLVFSKMINLILSSFSWVIWPGRCIYVYFLSMKKVSKVLSNLLNPITLI